MLVFVAVLEVVGVVKKDSISVVSVISKSVLIITFVVEMSIVVVVAVVIAEAYCHREAPAQ